MAKLASRKQGASSDRATVTSKKISRVMTSSLPPSTGTPLKRQQSTSAIFGKHTPPRRLCLPQIGNITATEQVVFHPESLRSSDPLLRFLKNGGDTAQFARMANYHRTQVKDSPISDNAIRKTIQHTMREKGYRKWTCKKQLAGDFDNADDVWDVNNLTFTGAKVHCQDFPNHKRYGGLPIANVGFASLANDVKYWPDEASGDALDLTRCVKATVANHQYALMYPRDFEFLTNLLGGPRPVA